MARLYADENFPLAVVEELRRLGHDVLTAAEAGKANLLIPDEAVLARILHQDPDFWVRAGRSGWTIVRKA